MSGQPIGPKTPSQHRVVQALHKNDIVFAIGPAGTGKTYVAVALAIAALRSDSVKRIVITRPAIEAGEQLGFLPGSLREKIDPYLAPIYDAFTEIVGRQQLEAWLSDKVVEIVPLAYMRGRTLAKAFIIADEMENATYAQLKMLVTRLGLKSKMLINGDRTQTDLPNTRLSSLQTAERVLGPVVGIKFVSLDSTDVVRHPLVAQIVDAYETFEFSYHPDGRPHYETNGVH